MDQNVSRTINGTANADSLVGDDSNEQFFGFGGNDQIDGRGGDDLLTGGDGNDQLLGGTGMDTAIYAGAFSQYQMTYRAGVLSVQDTVLGNGDEGLDSLRDVEILQFSDRSVGLPDPLRYLASHTDLMRAYGANTEAAMNHYLSLGLAEGRVVNGFDAGLYLAKYSDLRAAFGSDETRALQHYVQTGFAEGRSNNLSGNDVLVGTGGDDKLVGEGGHDTLIGGGGNDLLIGGIGSDAAEYAGPMSDYGLSYRGGVITVQDKVLGNGNDGTDTLREFEILKFTDLTIRLPDPLRYLAGNPDLMRAFGADTDAAMNHFLSLGPAESRAIGNFSPAVYLSKYADLRSTFGSDSERALRHYVENGFAEGRTDSLKGDDMLFGTGGADTLFGDIGNDRLTGSGGDDLLAGAAGVDTAVYGGGFSRFEFSYANGEINVRDMISGSGNEGRDQLFDIEVLQFGDRTVTLPDALRYLASNGDLITAFKGDANAAMTHYLNNGVEEGRSTTSFDAALYLAKYADVRAAYGDNVAAATKHYVEFGYAEGRTVEAGNSAQLVGVNEASPFV